MKTMKKWMSALLAVVLLMSMACIPAAAEEISSITEGAYQVYLNAGEYAVCSFTPQNSSHYYIGAYDSGATSFAILDENAEVLTYEENGLMWWMEADTMYYIALAYTSEYEAGTVYFELYDVAYGLEADRSEAYETYVDIETYSWYSFTPDRTTYYTIRDIATTDAEKATFVTLYDSKGNLLATGNGRENGGGFTLSALLRSGKTYYYGVQYYSEFDYGTIGFTLESEHYPDVAPSAWYYEAADYVTDRGFMSGYANGYFGPSDNLQRQDFVVTLARVAGADLSAYQNDDGGLSDVQIGSYYAPAVAWAVDNGIVSGYMNGEFGVSDAITREQVCTILYNYKGSPVVENVEETLSAFPDSARITDFAVDAMAWAVQSGVVSGMQSGEISPISGASRAQIASILMRMDQNGLL